MSDLVRFTVSIEPALYHKLETLVENNGYTNRSEFFRDLVRDRLVEEEWKLNEEATGTITLLYDHHRHGLTEKLTHLQHDYHAAILASTHVHLDHDICAEVILARGPALEIKKLADQMRQLKGVLHAGLSIGSTGKELA